MSAWLMIQHRTVDAAGLAEIEFTSIPQTFTDLCLVVSLRCTRATGSYDLYRIQLNGSNNISLGRTLEASGGTRSTESRVEVGLQAISTNTTNVFNTGVHYIPNYAASSEKTFSGDSGMTSGILLTAGRITSGTAITSLKLVSGVGSFVQHSTATLYGITAGSSGGVTVS